MRDIVNVESVQCKYLKWLMGFNKMAYEERLQELRLPSLEQRRKVADLVQLHNQLVLRLLPGSAVSVQLRFHS